MPVPLQNQKFPLWPSFPLINKPFNLNKLHSSAISKRRHLHCQLPTTLWGEELCPLLKGLPCCILCLGFGINGAQSSQLSGWYPFKGIISQNCWGRAQFSFASECGANCLTVMASLFGRCRTCRRNLLSSLARRVSSVLTKYKLEPSMDEDWWKVTRPRAQIRPSVIHRVAQSRTRLKWLSMPACIREGNGNPLQYSCLENPRDGGAWWAAVHRVTQSRTRLKRLSMHSMHACMRFLTPSTGP